VGTRYTAGDNAFFALNMDDGSVAWSFSDGGSHGKFGPVNFQASVEYKAPSAPEHRVYFTSFARGVPPDNTVWCLDLDTGGVAWAAPVTNVSTSPSFDASLRRIYVGTFDGAGARVQALDADSGSVIWSQPTGDGLVKGFVTVDRLTGDLYFATRNKIHAWTAGGSPKWAAPRADIPDPSAPVPVPGSGRVYVGGGDGKLHVLDASDGSDDVPPITLGDGLAAVGSPTLDLRGGRIYVGSEAGVVYAVDIP
jgi:outer membrane protein assembly factor BamB